MSKKSVQAKVEEFITKMGRPLPKRPCAASERLRLLWSRLLLEEGLELISGAGVTVTGACDGEYVSIDREDFEADGEVDMVEFADGVGDVPYVLIGFASLMGVTVDPILHEVCDNNLLKFGPGHSIREDGKLIKPPNHPRPDILGVLRRQGYQPIEDLDDLEIGDEIVFSPSFHETGKIARSLTGFITEAKWGQDGQIGYDLILSSGSRTVIVWPAEGLVEPTGKVAQWKPDERSLAVPCYMPPLPMDRAKPDVDLKWLAQKYRNEDVPRKKVWLRLV